MSSVKSIDGFFVDMVLLFEIVVDVGVVGWVGLEDGCVGDRIGGVIVDGCGVVVGDGMDVG